jgi:autotransporter translocation and assembly factor TamB
MQVEATGPPSRPDFNANIKGRDLAYGGQDVPSSSLLIDLQTKSGAATLDGKVDSQGTAPASFRASFPIGLSQADDGSLRWFDPSSPFEAEIEMPRLDLTLARPFLSSLKNLQGEISGHAKVQNHGSDLNVTGEFELRSTNFGFEGLASRVERLHGKIGFVDGGLAFQNFEGETGGGRFSMEGKCSFPQPLKPDWDFRWRADRVPLSGFPSLLATGELESKGNSSGGLLSGQIGFDGSRIEGQFAVHALLSQNQNEVTDFAATARIFPTWHLRQNGF